MIVLSILVAVLLVGGIFLTWMIDALAGRCAALEGKLAVRDPAVWTALNNVNNNLREELEKLEKRTDLDRQVLHAHGHALECLENDFTIALLEKKL
jgi:hypothetical protein